MTLSGRVATRAAGALARWLPSDPGYAPFGLRWLRGLNVLPYGLVAGANLVWMLAEIAPDVLSCHSPTGSMASSRRSSASRRCSCS